MAKKDRRPLTPSERAKVKAKYGDTECSFCKDDDGYFCRTHRARSESYSSPDRIPKRVVKFIENTGS